MSEKKSILKDKSFAFALKCIKLYQYLTDTKREFVMSKQLLRSGTSVGANIREAQNAESRTDFIHKLGIAQKECDETMYWLELLKASEYISQSEFDIMNSEANEIFKILRSSILTSKQKPKNSYLITHIS
ncbi:MAG: four helix bundle protein [Bacteroidia bacterium]